MNCDVYDSIVKNKILFYIKVQENIDNIITKLKLVDINLTFIPTYGIDIKRIITSNNKVIFTNDNKATINELCEGNNIYIVIEVIENKLYDKFIDFDNIKLGIDISYYDVELGKRINLCVGSSFTSENNERLEAIIHSIQVGNRKRIEPSSNVILLSDDSSDMTDDSSDMEL
jgi:hypothetical protein